MRLPSIREEIALLSGPTLADGQPSWSLHDPVRNQFFRIDWQAFEILSRWQFDDANAIVLDICATSTLKPDIDDVDTLIQFLTENQLLREVGAKHIHTLTSRLEAINGNWKKWLLHHYLFFRIPLVKPDVWLTNTINYVHFFYSPLFFKLTLAALVLGLTEVIRDWARFQSTLVDMFSWHGLASYGVALVVVKCLHELGHAYTAKRFGCRVPVMGVAFLVLWPVAYTDTNEVWKLTDRHKRLKVAAAGVLTELTIAAWATLAWVFLPVGELKSIAFILATTTWVATLAINASPFMRFDGYFLLSDWLDMPNLHARAFALARWNLREWLFNLNETPPEYFSKKRTCLLIVFAYTTWLYRLVLFFAIAALVYSFFIKLVGIFLFLIEIIWFVLMPLYGEFKVWRQKWTLIKQQSRLSFSVFFALFVLLLFFAPLPSRIVTSGLLKPEKVFTIYAPAGAQLVSYPWREGAKIKKGDLLMTLATPELSKRWETANARYLSAQKQLKFSGVDINQRSNLPVLQQQLEVAQAELQQVSTDIEQYSPHAPFNGVIYLSEPDVVPSVWVKQQEKIATLVSENHWLVETYLDDDEIREIEIGDEGIFMSDGRGQPSVTLKVMAIDKDATRVLPNGILSAPAGGSVMVRDKKGQLIPDSASYRVTLAIVEQFDQPKHIIWRGNVVIRGDMRVPITRYIKSAIVLLWREAGF